MAKVPLSAKKEIPRKCLLCDKKFKSKEYLVSHIEKVHHETIPNDWSASRYENYLRTGKDHGVCIVCGEQTDWNESTWKYNRICDNKKCRDEVAKRAKKNMISKYGKVHLLNDADMQRKMIYAKRTSGTYYWSNDTGKKYPQHYASNPERKFLEMLDIFLNLDPSDIESPSPNTYVYTYEGKEHQYIPDHFIRSLNLEVEIKEPKDNQNMHPKIQAVDKVKESIKDDTMNNISAINYIKINGTDYSEFFQIFSMLKNDNDDRYMPTDKVSVKPISETVRVKYKDLKDIIPVNSFTSDYDRFCAMVDRLKTATMLSFNPKLGFKDILVKIEDQLFKLDTIRDCNELRAYCIDLKARLNRFSSGEVLPTGKTDHRLKYEADKAIKRIDDYIIPQIDIRMEYLGRKGITEGVNFTVKKNGKELKPIFIVLTYGGKLINNITRFGTGQQWTHASLSLDTELRQNISFGDLKSMDKIDETPRKILGFKDHEDTKESYKKKKSRYVVYMYLANDKEYQILTDVIEEFRQNRAEYRFDIGMLLKVWRQIEDSCTDNFVCSTFVAYLLGEMNPRLLDKHYSLYSPGDIAEIRQFTHIIDGYISDYSVKITDAIVEAKLKTLGCSSIRYDKEERELPNVVNEATQITAVKDGCRYKPVFVALQMGGSKFNNITAVLNNARFAHVSLATDTSFRHNFTYGERTNDERDTGGRKYGFTYNEDMFESHTSPDASYEIYMYLANPLEYLRFTEVIEEFKKKARKSKYSIRGLLHMITGKTSDSTKNMVCSSFVAYVLGEMNEDIIPKHYSLMSPGDFSRIPNLIKVDDGLMRFFDEEDLDAKVAKLLTERGYEDVKVRYGKM